jgi:hypothetical protein
MHVRNKLITNIQHCSVDIQLDPSSSNPFTSLSYNTRLRYILWGLSGKDVVFHQMPKSNILQSIGQNHFFVRRRYQRMNVEPLLPVFLKEGEVTGNCRQKWRIKIFLRQLDSPTPMKYMKH